MPTKAEVFEAAAILAATRGATAPTVDSVRAFIGRGSKTDITRHLRAWRERQKLYADVPAVVRAKAVKLATELWMLARWDAGDWHEEAATGELPALARAPAPPDIRGFEREKSRLQLIQLLQRGIDVISSEQEAPATPEAILRHIDHLATRLSSFREEIVRAHALAGELTAPDAKRPKRPRRKADELTPAVAAILWKEKRPMYATEIYRKLPPELQAKYDEPHFTRTLASRSQPGVVVRWSQSRRKWRHTGVIEPGEKPKKRVTYKRRDTERARKRGAMKEAVDRAVDWILAHDGDWHAKDLYMRIHVPGIDLIPFQNAVRRRTYYKDDITKVGQNTFRRKQKEDGT